MNIDSFFSKGSSHQICQDYAAHQNANIVAVLADGCSGVARSEIGAQLLCMSKLSGRREFIRHADMIAYQLDLSPDVLSATTLFFEVIEQNLLSVEIWGDGAYYIKTKDGLETFALYEYAENAPYYPVHFQYPRRMDAWKRYFPENYCYRIDEQGNRTLMDSVVKEFTLDLNEVEKLFLFSDGITTFQTENTFDMIRRFVDVPNANGEFIARKFNFMTRKFGLPTDDFSCIALINEN